MKKTASNKKLILPMVAVASIALSSFSLAGTSPINTGNNNDSKAINGLGNKIVALALAGVTAFDNAMYQFDQNLLNVLNANTASKTVAEPVAHNASKATDSYINSSFQVIPNQLLSTSMGMINAKKIREQRIAHNNLTNKLTMAVPASDTLYSNNPQVIMAQYETGSNYYIGPPKVNDDNYFNVASVLSPTGYTPGELKAARDYMTYFTKSYNNPANKIDLSKLHTKLQTMTPKKQYVTLHNIVSGQSLLGSTYQQYQLALRSNMAAKSIAINNFNHLIAERSPSKTAVSGITNKSGKTITHPSQLQVESYQANHRIDNPAWIKSLQSQSSTTLQRETVVLLAEIAHQNYQAHIDRERILTTLSDIALQGSTASQMIMNTKAEAVNKAINSLANGTGSDSGASSGGTSNAEKIKEEIRKKDINKKDAKKSAEKYRRDH